MASPGTETMEQSEPLSPITVGEKETLQKSKNKDVVRLRDVPMATGFCIVSTVFKEVTNQKPIIL